MIRKIVLFTLLLVFVIAIVIGYKFFTGRTGFDSKYKYLYIYSDSANKQSILKAVKRDSIVKNVGDFEFLANRADYWSTIKPGRYRIQKGESVYEIVKKLRSGDHYPVSLVINKLRGIKDLARLIGRNFETDSASVVKYLDSSRLEMYYKIIPNTYFVPWTYSPQKIMQKLNEEYDIWWQKKDRILRAQGLGYSPSKIYIIASIVEEETNIPEDKKLIASVYFNRLAINMPLQADPTIRYALGDFTINRIYYNDLRVNSPYNTYLYTGIPPGPICTPSPATIDAVLDAPKTDYLYFVAKPDLKGGSTFTSNLKDHSRAAREYQDSLTAWLKRKALRQQAINDSIANAKEGK